MSPELPAPVPHASRQTGKTTFLINWMHEMNRGGQYVACYVTVETCQGIPSAERAIPAIASAIRSSARIFNLPEPPLPDEVPEQLLRTLMQA